MQAVAWTADLDSATAGYQTRVAFVITDNSSPRRIDAIAVDISNTGALTVGGQSTLLQKTYSLHHPLVSRDGATLYAREGAGSVGDVGTWLRAPVDGSAASEQLAGTDDAQYLDISPDEAYRVWSNNPWDGRDLFRQQESTGTVVNLTSSRAWERMPRWNPAWTDDID
jgi:hypothetical protein